MSVTQMFIVNVKISQTRQASPQDFRKCQPRRCTPLGNRGGSDAHYLANIMYIVADFVVSDICILKTESTQSARARALFVRVRALTDMLSRSP